MFFIFWLQNDSVVAGGGAIEMELSKYLRDYSRTIPGKQQLLIGAYAKALEVIPRQLCDNAGFDATNILNKLRARHAQVSILILFYPLLAHKPNQPARIWLYLLYKYLWFEWRVFLQGNIWRSTFYVCGKKKCTKNTHTMDHGIASEIGQLLMTILHIKTSVRGSVCTESMALLQLAICTLSVNVFFLSGWTWHRKGPMRTRCFHGESFSAQQWHW